MFIGHFAPALAARAITSEAPKLGTLFVAAQMVDIAFFLLVMGGVEHLRITPGITAMNPLDLYDYPITHSLAGTAAWAVAFGLIVAIVLRNAVAATWAAIVVLSHWILDWVSHRPDLTLAGGTERYGLGLWNQPLLAMAVELGIFGLAFWWYVKRTKGPSLPPLILAAVMLVLQAYNWFGPEPVDAGPGFLLLGLFAFALMIVFASWVGSTRWHRNELGLGVASPPI
ncbi:hypothetical protein [Erythrobacter sp. SD-21]|uniref:hypothetical protein n=1 Tax=Erythrobacter sp. SD-21 TaxID=161528 RepID=UPI000153F84D|nr:hypothetical protein [Erythrobacter sp. SD-21]EDL50566.1 hypothetical protein ED21_28883 [Erythrobacter sp. SD-21]